MKIGFKNKILDSISILLLFTTLFLFGPLQIFLTNIQEININLLELMVLSIPPVLILYSSSIVILLILPFKEKSFQLFISLFFGLSFLFWIQGNFIIFDFGPLNNDVIDWRSKLGMGISNNIIWVIGLVFIVLKRKTVYKYSRKLSIILFIIQATVLFLMILSIKQVLTSDYVIFDESTKFNYSKSTNVIVLILDEFKSDVFNEIIENNPALKNNFNDFTYFRNAIAQYPWTLLALPHILTGKSYFNDIPYDQYIKESYLANSLPRVLKENGFQVDLHPWVPLYLLADSRVASNIKKQSTRSLKELIKKGHHVFELALFRYMPYSLKPILYNNGKWFFYQVIKTVYFQMLSLRYMGSGSEPSNVEKKVAVTHNENKSSPSERKTLTDNTDGKADKTMNKRRGENRDGGFKKINFFKLLKTSKTRLADIEFIVKMQQKITAINPDKVFKFYHLYGCHSPIAVNENFVGEKMIPNRSNYIRQAKGYVKFINTFIETLKKKWCL